MKKSIILLVVFVISVVVGRAFTATVVSRELTEKAALNSIAADSHSEISFGNIPDRELWYVFGYNGDVDTGTEVIRSNGGNTVPVYLTASKLNIVSSSAADDVGSTGATRIYIEGVDASYNYIAEYANMDGVNTVQTTLSFLNVNRVSVTVSGTGRKNAGTITLTRASDASVAKAIPIGASVSQGSSYTVGTGKVAYLSDVFFNGAKPVAGTDPEIIYYIKIYDSLTNTEYEIFRDATPQGEHQVNRRDFKDQPLRAGQTVWMEATVNQDNTQISGAMTIILAPAA